MTNSSALIFNVSDLRGAPCGTCGVEGKLNLPFEPDDGTMIYESRGDTVTFIPDRAITA